MKHAWTVAVAVGLVVAGGGCGGGARDAASPSASSAGTVTAPGDETLSRLRRDAARYLGCSAARVVVTREAWDGAKGRYVADGCGWRVPYLVGCDAPDVCGFAVVGEPTAGAP